MAVISSHFLQLNSLLLFWSHQNCNNCNNKITIPAKAKALQSQHADSGSTTSEIEATAKNPSRTITKLGAADSGSTTSEIEATAKNPSRTITKLAYQGTREAVLRAKEMVREYEEKGEIQALDYYALEMAASAAARHGDPLFGAQVLGRMLEMGMAPHVKAWSAVLSRLAKYADPSSLDISLALFDEFCEAAELGGDHRMKPDAGAFNAILNGCAIAGRLDTAQRLMSRMDSLGVIPDAVTYNILIKLYARLSRKDLLIGVVENMLSNGIPPCITTFHSLVAAYVGLGDLDLAKTLVNALRSGRLDICSLMRSASGGGGGGDGDGDPLLLLPRTYKPNSQIYTTLMKGYMDRGRLDDMMQVLLFMQQDSERDCQPDEVSYTTAISAFVKSGLMEEAHRIAHEMSSKKVPANLITYNVLLSGYCRSYQIDKARSLMSEMVQDAGIRPDIVSYNTMINGCIGVDDHHGALAYFSEMRSAGIPPTHVSYTTLMKAFGRICQPNVVERIFSEMQNDPTVVVDVVAWNTLIQSYCDSGRINDAKEAFLLMKGEQLLPTVATYGILVNGFVKAKRPGEVLLLWQEIKDRIAQSRNRTTIREAFEPDEVLLDSIVVYLVKTAFFQKALEVIAYMEEFNFSPKKTKYKRTFVALHSMIYMSEHKSEAKRNRRQDKRQAAEAFKFWLGLPNNYYSSEWKPDVRND